MLLLSRVRDPDPHIMGWGSLQAAGQALWASKRPPGDCKADKVPSRGPAGEEP